ncbi:MAG: DUF1422 family protein [Klebsiella michiganensis]|nr:DUF1422 family protein [Klebsiella michiganensis]
MKHSVQDRGTLLLALIAGLSINGTFAALCFILGVLVYSTVVRAEYPDIGSNFFPAVLSVIMVFWIGYKLRNRKNAVAE